MNKSDVLLCVLFVFVVSGLVYKGLATLSNENDLYMLQSKQGE